MNKSRKKNILITGGKGYIGQYLSEYFADENVYITTRTPKRENERKLLLEKEDTIEGVCKDIDIVIHTASMDERRIPQNPKEALLVNTYGTRNLYLDAIACGVKKFLYLSTFHVYGETADPIITEKSCVAPVSDYALTHFFAEQYIRQLQKDSLMQTAVLRLTNGIGLPGRDVDKWYLVFNDFCRTVVSEKRIRLKSKGLQRRDFVAIMDICRAIKALIDTNIDFSIYNVSSQKTFSIREIAVMVKDIYKKLSGEEAELDLPEVNNAEIQGVKDFTVSSQKLRKLGWEPEETVEIIIEQILKNRLEENK